MMERHSRKPYSDLERRVMASHTMINAKVAEYQAHVQAGRAREAEDARNAASAALDVHLDLTKELIEADLKKGWS